jgi:glycosyltransferase involved in cell wall biosynthesis
LRTLSDGEIADTRRRSTREQCLTPRACPVISVIVPVFNGERFIREALESIVSQGYPSLEIIVIDDGSTDTTKDIIEELPFEVRYFRQDNLGPAAARNKGIREATGEFVAFIDVDDLWPENNLTMLAKELLADKDIDVIHGYAQLARYNDVTHECEYAGNPAESFPCYIGAALYRRSVFTKVGLFDPTLLFGEDTDWFKRAEELKVNIRRLEEVTLIVRRHGKNMTSAKDMVELNHLRVFKKSLDRMRARRQAGHVLP